VFATRAFAKEPPDARVARTVERLQRELILDGFERRAGGKIETFPNPKHTLEEQATEAGTEAAERVARMQAVSQRKLIVKELQKRAAALPLPHGKDAAELRASEDARAAAEKVRSGFVGFDRR
jgi:hypothetical protein